MKYSKDEFPWNLLSQSRYKRDYERNQFFFKDDLINDILLYEC